MVPPPPPSGDKLVVTKAFVYDPEVTEPIDHTTVQWTGYEEEFVITVTNAGTSASGPVTLTDTLDPIFENAVVTLDPGNGSCAIVVQALSCSLPTIAVGQTRTVSVAYRLATVAEVPGSLVNCATATDSAGKATQACSTLSYVKGPN